MLLVVTTSFMLQHLKLIVNSVKYNQKRKDYKHQHQYQFNGSLYYFLQHIISFSNFSSFSFKPQLSSTHHQFPKIPFQTTTTFCSSDGAAANASPQQLTTPIELSMSLSLPLIYLFIYAICNIDTDTCNLRKNIVECNYVSMMYDKHLIRSVGATKFEN